MKIINNIAREKQFRIKIRNDNTSNNNNYKQQEESEKNHNAIKKKENKDDITNNTNSASGTTSSSEESRATDGYNPDDDNSSISSFEDYAFQYHQRKYMKFRTELSKDPKYRIINDELPRPNFDPPSPASSSNKLTQIDSKHQSKQSDDSTSSAASYPSPLSDFSGSIVDGVQILSDSGSIDSDSETPLDTIPPQKSQETDENSSLASKISSKLVEMPSSPTTPPLPSSTFTYHLKTTSIKYTGRKPHRPRTRKHKNRFSRPMDQEFIFRKGTSSTPVTHTNGKNSEEADVAAIEDNQRSLSDTKPSIKLQSLDSLDDHELVDYLDTVSDVLQSQTDDLIPQEPHQTHTNSITQMEPTESTDPIPTLDSEESKHVGDRKTKSDDAIRISTFNSNGLPLKKLKDQLQYCASENIDIQCFVETNENMVDHRHRKKFNEAVRQFDRSAKDVWANTDIQMQSTYKPGGTGMVSFQSVAGRIKECGTDRPGRWCYQVFDSGSDFKSVIFSIYRCNKTTLKDSKKTAYRQQRILQAELGYRGDPTRYFKAELIREIKRLQSKYGSNLCPYILGDFNDCNNIQ